MYLYLSLILRLLLFRSYLYNVIRDIVTLSQRSYFLTLRVVIMDESLVRCRKRANYFVLSFDVPNSVRTVNMETAKCPPPMSSINGSLSDPRKGVTKYTDPINLDLWGLRVCVMLLIVSLTLYGRKNSSLCCDVSCK